MRPLWFMAGAVSALALRERVYQYWMLFLRWLFSRGD